MKKCIAVDVLRHIHRLAGFVHPVRPKKETPVKCQNSLSAQSKPFCSIRVLIWLGTCLPKNDRRTASKKQFLCKRNACKCNVYKGHRYDYRLHAADSC